LTNIEQINWEYLEECISRTSSPKVNISGGGDPFYKYSDHSDFYARIYEVCRRNNKLLDAHTRILPKDKELLRKFNKLAVTVEHDNEKSFEELSSWFPEFSELVKLRVIDVVDKNLNLDDCENYIKRMKKIGIKQITFRQMFGDKEAAENYLRLKRTVEKKDGVLFLDDGEYHDYYFTTTNQLLPFFFGNSNEDREIWRKKYENRTQKCV
jgi:hypothetical protein